MGCKTATVLVDVTLDVTTSNADEIVVQAFVAGQAPWSTTIAHEGPMPASIEVELPGGYVAGERVDFTIVALEDGLQVGQSAHGTIEKLPAGCGTVSISFGSDGGAGSDGSAADGPTDAATPETRADAGEADAEPAGDGALLVSAVCVLNGLDHAVRSLDVSLSLGRPCGACGGVIQCDGSCSKPTPPDLGAPCGACGGVVTCEGVCSVPTPATYGMVCGTCGGALQCDGTCSKTPANFGADCGSCGGKVACDGQCSVATPANLGAACGSCGGTVQCDGSCSKATPANFGAACGSCGGTFQCDGSCSKATPANLGAACGSCSGAIQCDGSCSKATPANLGATCGSCGGKVMCDGTCSVSTPANYGAACNQCGTVACDATCHGQTVTRCNDTQPQTCGATGNWQNTGPITAGTCGAACNPGTAECASSELVDSDQICGADGRWAPLHCPAPDGCNGYCDSTQPGGCAVSCPTL